MIDMQNRDVTHYWFNSEFRRNLATRYAKVGQYLDTRRQSSCNKLS